MKQKEVSSYEKYEKQSYERKKAKGWVSIGICGPPPLIDGIKAFVRKYKLENGLYQRNVAGTKKK